MENSHITQKIPEVTVAEILGHSYHFNHPDSTPKPHPSRSSQLTPPVNDLSTSHKPVQQLNPESSSGFAQWRTKWITDWWGMELACWFLAALSLIGIVIALESHKNRPLPEWPLGITLNSLISILATMGQMAMMNPIVEAISQLKWLWFVRKERISGFQAFDGTYVPHTILFLLHE